MNFFQQNGSDNSQEYNGLYLNNRQLSIAIAGGILLAFFVFVAGYFLGQKTVLEKFANKAEQDSLGDKISSSMYSIYDAKADVAESNDSSESEEALTVDEQEPAQVQDESMQAAVSVVSTAETMQEASSVQEAGKKYYAELVGFGSQQSAQAFAHRLEKKGIAVAVKKRDSKSSRGKLVSWYQVVTQPCDSSDTLASLVERLKRDEHLKGVRIVSC